MSGPYLVAAVFCSEVLEQKDSTVSAIRIVDRVTVAEGQDRAPLPTLLVILRPGDYSGVGQVVVEQRLPSGGSGVRVSFDEVPLDSKADQGVNLILRALQLRDPEEGLHCFDVAFNGERLGTTLLRVVFRQPSAEPSGQSSPS